MNDGVIRVIKNLIKQTFLYDILLSNRHKREVQSWEKDVRTWEKAGKPIPPPFLIKQNIVKKYANNFSLHTFVETGTYWGDMIFAVRNTFSKIFSIELDDRLYKMAKKRFIRYSHIQIIQGNSGEVLPDVLLSIKEPVLFWLDAHKGADESPIIKELEAIFTSSIPRYAILIDDVRDFTGKNGYPTVEELRKFIFQHKPDLKFEVEEDIIRIT